MYSKRLHRIGKSSLSLILTQDMLYQLGVDSTQDDASVSLVFYGDALVVRRDGALPLNPQQVASLFGLEPHEAVQLPRHVDFSDVQPMIREILEVLGGGATTVMQLAEMLDLKPSTVSARLRRAEQHNYVRKEGSVYILNEHLFYRG